MYPAIDERGDMDAVEGVLICRGSQWYGVILAEVLQIEASGRCSQHGGSPPACKGFVKRQNGGKGKTQGQIIFSEEQNGPSRKAKRIRRP